MPDNCSPAPSLSERFLAHATATLPLLQFSVLPARPLLGSHLAGMSSESLAARVRALADATAARHRSDARSAAQEALSASLRAVARFRVEVRGDSRAAAALYPPSWAADEPGAATADCAGVDACAASCCSTETARATLASVASNSQRKRSRRAGASGFGSEVLSIDDCSTCSAVRRLGADKKGVLDLQRVCVSSVPPVARRRGVRAPEGKHCVSEVSRIRRRRRRKSIQRWGTGQGGKLCRAGRRGGVE